MAIKSDGERLEGFCSYTVHFSSMIYSLAASLVIGIETPADILFYTLIYRVSVIKPAIKSVLTALSGNICAVHRRQV